MAKAAKPAPVEAEAPVKPKSKRLVLALIGVLLLALIGGGVWWFLFKDKDKEVKHEEKKPAVVEQPTFLVLEPFTVNLQHEETGDEFLQIGITLKVNSNELAEKLRSNLPEVRSRVIFLLSSKRPSELLPIEGKRKLAQEIADEANGVLGKRSAPHKKVAEPASGIAAEAPAETMTHEGGVVDVLFTAFVIQ